MPKRNLYKLKTVDALADMLFIYVAFLLSMVIRFRMMDGVMIDDPLDAQIRYWLTAIYAFVLVCAFYMQGLYSYGRHRQIAQDIGIIIRSNFVGLFVYIAAFALLRTPDYSRIAQFIFGLLSTVFMVVKHTATHIFLRRYRVMGLNQKHTVVIGNGRLARKYIETAKKEKDRGVTVMGYVSREEKAQLGKALGSYEEVPAILEKLRPDEVVIALEAHETAMMPVILMACEHSGTRTSIIPYYNDYLPRQPQIEVFGGCKLMNIRTIPLDDLFSAALKRSMDIVGSLVLLVLSSPIMLLVAVGVKLSSPGPILFRQQRVGRNKQPFEMLKFRSMRTDIDHTGWTTDDDPRKTKFGSFIRKYSLDELPQFLNVLLGQMSLVGPRPELPNFVEQFSEEIPLYLVRHQVRPGITGWAQVNGYRGDTSISKRVECDIWYIENWTWLLDIKILLMTLFGGFVNSEKKAKAADEADAPEASFSADSDSGGEAEK